MLSLARTPRTLYHGRMDASAKPEDRKLAQAPLEWSAHEYVHVEKTTEWYWALGLVAVAGAIAALLANDVLFALFILIIAFVLALFASRPPQIVHFSISQRGVRIDDDLHPYNSIKSFAIHELSPDHTPKLILETSRMIVPHIVIPLEGIHADDVHKYLARFLPEEDHVEPLSHRIMEWLGF